MKRRGGFSSLEIVISAWASLAGIPGLLAVVAFPKFHLLRSALVIVLNGPLCEICRFFREKLSAEEARIDSDRIDTKRFDLSLQRLHPALKAELRRRAGGAKLKRGETRG